MTNEMSRPTGPPPYTAEEIERLDTAEARFRARAELKSYITGHKQADLREQGLLGAPSYTWTNPNATSSPLQSDASLNEDSSGDTSSPPGYAVGHQRGTQRKHTASRFGPYARHARPNQAGHEGKRDNANPRDKRAANSATICANFTSTGKCARVNCFDVHDVNKLALCKAKLYKDDCSKGDFCSLSHRATKNNTPHCTYYIDDRCKKESCVFLHAHVGRNAPVCESFGKIGYCAKGEDCSSLHVYECPDFANSGTCVAGESCPLRHVHHSSRMKTTVRNSGIGSPTSVVDDDSDAMEDVSSPQESDSHAITQQHDYVAFDSD